MEEEEEVLDDPGGGQKAFLEADFRRSLIWLKSSSWMFDMLLLVDTIGLEEALGYLW